MTDVVESLGHETKSPDASVLNSLQYLRALAALMIVMYHLISRLWLLGYRGAWPTSLAAGVDIFFVLSGYLMWTTTARSSPSFFEFLGRRIKRIVPMYWLVTLFNVAIILLIPSLNRVSHSHPSDLLKSLFFIPTASPPIIPQGWTLNYEMWFYVLFAAVLFFAANLRLIMVTLILLAAGLFGDFFQTNGTIQFFTNDIIIEFGMGIILGRLSSLQLKGQGFLGLIIIFVSILSLILSGHLRVGDGMPAFPETLRVLKFGIPAAGVVLGCLLLEAAKPVADWSIIKLLGDASYSIYLSHGLVLTAFAVVWQRLPAHSTFLGLATYSVGAVASAALAGCILYLTVEKKFINLLKTRRKLKPLLRAELKA